jgi:hypothetical protein
MNNAEHQRANLLYMAIAVLLAGCSKDLEDLSRRDAEISSIKERIRISTASVTVVEMKDGTRCAIYHGYGISCDWSAK